MSNLIKNSSQNNSDKKNGLEINKNNQINEIERIEFK